MTKSQWISGLFVGLILGLIVGLASACGNIVDAPVPITDDAGGGVVTKPLGTGCSSSADCESGVCTDGVCCASECEGACARCDLEGSVGTCKPVPSGTECGDSTCAANMERAAPQCDGAGSCIGSAFESCGKYVCDQDTACFSSCTSDSACATGNVCADGECAPPSCSDDVKTAPETDVDCGGPQCPKCRGARTCSASTDCQSGTCSAGVCTEPTYAWKTTAFNACSASSCGNGQQVRSVWCERSDGTTVADTMCTSSRPVTAQACTNTQGCSWFAGTYGACSVRCGGGSQTRPVYCRDTIGSQVPNAWCSGAAPTASQSCNPHACVVYVVGEPSAAMGPCWAPPNCAGGYPAAPACPAGYSAVRTETACGNPNSPGSNWALQIFQQTVHYGCSNPSYVMGVVARQCAW